MPALIPMLWGFLLNIMGTVVGKVLLALGFSYVAYSGFDLTINWLLEQIKTSFAGMPAEVVAFLAWLWVDKAISLMFSAYTVCITYKLAGATSIKKMVLK